MLNQCLWNCFARSVVMALVCPLILSTVQPFAWAQDAQKTNSESEFAFDLPTVAESSGYQATATDEQVESYLRRLASHWPSSELTTLGRTIENRPIWALVVEPKSHSSNRNENNENNEHNNSKPLTVMMLGGIHAGECDGKEALLALARDLAQEADKPSDARWWRSLRLIFVPNLNADGNERRGKLHRPGQVGPDQGMGIRENAQGLDLNRDFIKLESPEIRSVVAAINHYDVDVLIDTHTTNGSVHRYDLTYDITHNPAVPPNLDLWMRTKLLPDVTEQLAADGIESFYYGNFDQDYRRWESFGWQPRYSTEYMGLRGRIGILSESYSYVSYQRRVEATYAFLNSTLRALAKSQPELREMIDQNRGFAQSGNRLATKAHLTKTDDAVLLKTLVDDKGVVPSPQVAKSSKLNEKGVAVQLWNRAEGTDFVKLPAAYVVEPEYGWAVSRLQMHGIRLKQLQEPLDIEVEEYRVHELKRGESLQDRTLLDFNLSEVKTLTRTFRTGTYLVEVDQPLGLLAAYLLEPQADDSLVRWGFFAPEIRAGDSIPVWRVKEAVAASNLIVVEKIASQEQLTLAKLMQPGHSINLGSPILASAQWLGAGSEYLIRKDNSWLAVDAASGAMRPVEELQQLADSLAKLQAFPKDEAKNATSPRVFANNWKHALIEHRQDLYFYDAASQLARQLTHSAKDEKGLSELSPDGKFAAFVQHNNLWVVDCNSTELKQLTKDGSNELLNGTLDWVYQEELYGRGNFKAFWWSPDSSKIAFLQLDQTPVQHYEVSDSTAIRQSLEDTRYPKAGDPMPIARMWIADVATGGLRIVDLSSFEEKDRLIARVTWSPTNELWLQVFNRIQNQQSLVLVDPQTGLATTLFTESSPGWLEVLGTPVFLSNGNFLWLSDLPHGRRHLFLVAAKSGRKTQLTSGEWDVDSFLGVDSKQQTAFVSGNISHPTELHLVAVDIEQAAMHQVTKVPGTHRVKVDPTGEFFIDDFSSFETPPLSTLNAISGQQIRVLRAGTSDRSQFVKVQQPWLTTIASRDGLPLQAAVMLPPGTERDRAEQKLPVLFCVYGGPQAPTVQNSWNGLQNYWWHQMLCQQGYAVVFCDNRASRGRGIKDTWTIRGDLGRVELADLEDAVKWVSQQPWADESRIGIWGWSYGGYFTAYAMTHSQLFKAGISGAPVTDWRNYDSIYTERYMDLPQNNAAGYKSSSVVEAAKNLHGRLLLIHGERDDNVHLSNSLQLVNALQNADKQFDFMVYPKNRHGVDDPEQRFHMYRMMTNFLNERLAR